MLLEKIFTTVIYLCFVYLFSFAQEDKKESGLSGSDLNEKLSAPDANVVLLDEDLNLDGVTDILSVSLVKKINKNTYWISRGIIREDNKDEVKTLLSFEDRILLPDGSELISQVPADNGYIISIEKKSEGVVLYISLADKDGNSTSDELQLKWNSNNNKFEILNF